MAVFRSYILFRNHTISACCIVFYILGRRGYTEDDHTFDDFNNAETGGQEAPAIFTVWRTVTQTGIAGTFHSSKL